MNILLIILLVLLLAGNVGWGYSTGFGLPQGGIGLVLLILLIVLICRGL